MIRELTGRHVLLIFVGAFGLIFAVNFTMMFMALDTFPGLVVKNFYVASQGWNERTAAQAELGWKTAALYEDGRLAVSITGEDGAQVPGLAVNVLIGRPTTAAQDQRIPLAAGPDGYTADIALAPGLWRLELQVEGVPAYDQHATFFVKAPD
jgi:nitrogen fixation protein FixH